jgi:hypothetical protein
VAFCEWLSRREGKPYRLPTEAEWEFICRAGTRTPFAGGATPDQAGIANGWGVKNMQASVAEWCSDWWARYPRAAQTDPVGPASGTLKVVRGGALDYRKSKIDAGKFLPAESSYYRRSANRACGVPNFASPQGHIGFRVVQAPMPATAPLKTEPNFFTTAIKQNTPDLKIGPDSGKPYYRTRAALSRSRRAQHARRRMEDRPRAGTRTGVSQLGRRDVPQRRSGRRLLQHAALGGRDRSVGPDDATEVWF